jgi:hypothetical protein
MSRNDDPRLREVAQPRRGFLGRRPRQADATRPGAAPAADGGIQPGTPVPLPHPTPRAWLLIAPAVTLAIGVLLGLGLESVRSGGRPPSSTASPASVIQPAPAPVTVVVTRPTASSACLETARRADRLIHLLITNRRNDAADLLVAYSVASRQCRRDASP